VDSDRKSDLVSTLKYEFLELLKNKREKKITFWDDVDNKLSSGDVLLKAIFKIRRFD